MIKHSKLISASDAPTVTVDGKSEDSVTLSWEPPENTYGTILVIRFLSFVKQLYVAVHVYQYDRLEEC